MLQTQTVSPELLELLRKISNSDFFSDFFLVGGTALALQIGHRNSIDLDFFAKKDIDENLFLEKLSEFGKVIKFSSSKNILICSVNGVKVDFVNHIYKFLDEPLILDGIKMASKRDISAMKLNAIEGRGSKKDFIDLYFLLNYMSLPEMIEAYKLKYPNHSEFMMLKSLTYFEDADHFPQPEMFADFNWENAKQKIIQEFLKL
ncbi:Nucleotidyl transferase AbiEii toxin, Type IV TA system [Halpernia humi]|uniref:Nucleotidyl transferase AbiEii toxin, Type IV TA system n=1 Tax=Halpernia humi TaxID=493375 RepID=A0A1H5SCJ9_9FLAO|nr:nucleotidyl transferase AbiEii/AbiGii toxin family protein [Halpernia humi]SEF48255.1 Nucleotidyl transferase AbiEii toxin, Type IV TA system [Halpernia humi]